MAIIHVGAVLFEDFELLDFYGPLEMFGLLKNKIRITVVAESVGSVKSGGGPSGFAEKTMAECDGFDVLLIPGGMGTRTLFKQPAFLNQLRRLAISSRMVLTVCTGSLLLAATGLLDGHKATTNKRVFQLVKSSAPKVSWIPKARWVEDGKFITSSGISAGTDMALAVIAKFYGKETAMEIANQAEYEWHQDCNWDPFAQEG